MDFDSSIISFRVKSASIHFGMGFGETKTRTITFELLHDRYELVDIVNKQSLTGCDWSMTCRDSNNFNDFARDQNAIGFLSYYSGAYERLSARVAIEPGVFEELWGLVKRGSLPGSLVLTVSPPMDEYSNQLTWDIVNSPHLNIKEIDFSFSVAEEKKSDTTFLNNKNQSKIDFQMIAISWLFYLLPALFLISIFYLFK